MSEDIVMRLLRQVKSGEVSLEDARFALEDVNLTEEEYITAVDHGVFNMPKPGTIVRSSISPSASTWLVTIVFVWGCLLYTSPSPRDKRQSRMPSSA